MCLSFRQSDISRIGQTIDILSKELHSVWLGVWNLGLNFVHQQTCCIDSIDLIQ